MSPFKLIPEGSVPAIIMHYIGLLVCLIILFLGLVYVLDGNFVMSAFLTLAAGILLEVLTSWLVREKTREEEYKSKGVELGIMGGYLLIFVLLFPLCFHALSIDLFRKNEIKSACLSKLDALNDLKEEYNEAIVKKQTSLDAEARTLFNDWDKFRNSGALTELNELLGSEPGRSQFNENTGDGLDEAIDGAKSNLRQKYELVDANKELTAFTKNAQTVFTNWQTQQIGYYYQAIDPMLAKYEAAGKIKMSDFSPTIELKNSLDFNDPIAMLQQSTPATIMLSLVGLLLVHVFILLPYITSKRFEGGFIKSDAMGPRDGTATWL